MSNFLSISIILFVFSLIILSKLLFYSGYMAPEYIVDGQYSVKSDVFSFGILLIEIISGKRNKRFYHEDSNLNQIARVSMIK